MDNSIDTYLFCEEIMSRYEHDLSVEVDKFLQLLEEFSKKYDSLARKLPYHINVIDELHVNENANSRILAALLQYKEGGDFTLLKSFVDFFMKDQNIEISQPTITSENFRIDLLVREPGKYAIIFENKIYGAVLQKNQIARYIQKMRNDEHFKDEQIHVVFLPPTEEYLANECSWIEPGEVCEACDCTQCLVKERSLKEAFKDRYFTITFREGVIEWLKEAVIPNCRQKEVYLYTAAMQYLDYLEGYFDLRTINKTTNMELQQLICEKLQLNGKTNEEQLNILKQKSDEINHLLIQIQLMKESIYQETNENTIELDLQHLIIDRLKLNENKTNEQKLGIIEKRINEINRLLNQIQSLKDSVRQNIYEDWKEKVKTKYQELRPLEKGCIVDVTIGYINGKNVTVSIFEYGRNLTLCCQVEIDDSLPLEERKIMGTKIMKLADLFKEKNEHYLWNRYNLYDCEGTFKFFEEIIEKCKELID